MRQHQPASPLRASRHRQPGKGYPVYVGRTVLTYLPSYAAACDAVRTQARQWARTVAG